MSEPMNDRCPLCGCEGDADVTGKRYCTYAKCGLPEAAWPAIAAKNAEAYKLNNARADWQTYFREEARPTKLPPKLEADIIARTPPGEGATLDDGTVWTVANGKVKRVR